MQIQKLSKLKVNEVSLVNKPANKRRFLILKEDNSMDKDVLEVVLKTEIENEDQVNEVLKSVSTEGQAAVKGALRLIHAFKEQLPQSVLKSIGKLAGIEPEVVVKEVPPQFKEKSKEEQEAEEMEMMKKKAAAAKKEGSACELKKSADGSYDLSEVPEGLRPTLQLVLKNHDETVEKAAELERKLVAEQTRREIDEYVEKAAKFDKLPVTAAELGPVLRTIAKADAKGYELIEKALTTANENMGKILTPVGSDAPNKGSANAAWAKIEKAAEGLIQKDSKTSMAQAIDIILKQHPDWYSEYLEENKKR